MGTAAGSQKRLGKELADAEANAPKGTSVEVQDNDLYKWMVFLEGPEGTAYQGATLRLKFTIPMNYPFKPPQVVFDTIIYHPNVDQSSGAICLPDLRVDGWKPATKIMGIVQTIRSLICEPNLDDAADSNIAAQYKDNRADFTKTAKDHTKRNLINKK